MLAVVLFTALASVAAAAAFGAMSTTTAIWMSVTLQGRKIGSMHQQRRVQDDRVITDETLHVDLDRAGVSIALDNHEQTIETRAGIALAFSSHTSMLGSDTDTIGKRLADGRFQIQRNDGGAVRTQIMDWPAGAKLAEGQRLATLAAGDTRGVHYQVVAYDPSALHPMQVQGVVLGSESVDLPDGAQTLTHTRDTVRLPAGGEFTSDTWSDAAGEARKLTMPMLGDSLVLLACDKTCATAPDQPLDLLTSTIAASPRALPESDRDGTLDYTIAVGSRAQTPFADTDEQQVRALGNGVWTVRVGAATANKSVASPESLPTAADTQANAWLQSDAPAIRALALKTAGNLIGAQARMRALQDFVRGYISEKDLSVGYATALETLHSREGDCTEHAVLLAALARALGIPARIEVGLAYAPQFAGVSQAFVPHMWVQAWTGDRWDSYDAALGRFDAGHIALGVGNGDPWRFYAGLTTLGNLRIQSIR